MRISDWSSDVCSSDLIERIARDRMIARAAMRQFAFIQSDVIEDEGRAGKIAVEREEGRDRPRRAVQPRQRDMGDEGARFGRDADAGEQLVDLAVERGERDRKSTRLNSSH